MKAKTHRYIISLIFLLILLSCISTITYANDKGGSSSINRFNVVVVLDASNSMNYTDPNGFRYEAISQFTSLLAEQGNYLGGIVFSNHVSAQQAPTLVNSQANKNEVTTLLKSVMSHGVTADMGYTNIGEALSKAVDMLLTSGSQDLPSVIVFLSDGNTEMPTTDEQTTSLNLKANAIQTARENKIGIYSVCLNANNKADTSEMEQISGATGGVFKEVSDAEDLQDVFNIFYSLIYGTSTITLVDDVFPATGVLETPFDVPGLGVEEVNIVINGSANSIALFDSAGKNIDITSVTSDTFTLIKITELTPGTWKLVTKGVPGDNIKINMIYNTNLGVDVTVDPESLNAAVNTPINVTATLKSGTNSVDANEQYSGYSASLQMMDAYGEIIEELPMVVSDGVFTATYQPAEGTYFLNVRVSGNYLEKTSSNIGPITVSATAGNTNSAPVPKENPIKKTVYIWPFKGGNLSIDMTELASDPENDALHYNLVSSSFIEGTDFSVNENIITLDHFSLSKGSFDIKVTDIGGLSCNVEVIVTSYNVGVMTCIGLAIAALIALLIIGGNIWYWSRKPFRGTISVQSYSNGRYKGTPRTSKRGKCKLSAFQLDPLGLDYNKSYFQATGQQFIWLNLNVPVIWNGQNTNKVRIQSGAEVTLSIKEGDSKLLYVRFDSRMRGTPRGPRQRPNTRRR